MTAEGEESVHATPLTTLTITQLPSTSTTMAEDGVVVSTARGRTELSTIAASPKTQRVEAAHLVGTTASLEAEDVPVERGRKSENGGRDEPQEGPNGVRGTLESTDGFTGVNEVDLKPSSSLSSDWVEHNSL